MWLIVSNLKCIIFWHRRNLWRHKLLNDFDEDNISSSPYQKKEKNDLIKTLFKTFMDQVKVYEILDIYTLNVQKKLSCIVSSLKNLSYIMIVSLGEV